MSMLRKIERHSALVNRMGEVTGADFVAGMTTGEISETDLRRTVVNCMRCQMAGPCEDWLDETGDGPAEAPEYCRNKAMMDRLSAL